MTANVIFMCYNLAQSLNYQDLRIWRSFSCQEAKKLVTVHGDGLAGPNIAKRAFFRWMGAAYKNDTYSSISLASA